MRGLLAAAMVLPLGVTSCSADDEQVLTVLAASSLTGVFEQLADDFEASHEGVTVRFSFGSSTTLAEQAVQGAPGDVLATADDVSMALADEGGATDGRAVTFAANRMVLAVPADNPAGIASYADLPGTDWIRCADDVPCGRIARSVIDATGPEIGAPASLEVDVKSVLAKVTSGEADAGFVYASDVAAASDDVRVIRIPGAEAADTTYRVAVLDQAEDAGLATAWIALLTSRVGHRALVEAGFTLP